MLNDLSIPFSLSVVKINRVTKSEVEIGEDDSLAEVEALVDAYKARLTDASRKIAAEAERRAKKENTKLVAQVYRLAH